MTAMPRQNHDPECDDMEFHDDDAPAPGPDGWAASKNRDAVSDRLHVERRLVWLLPAVIAASGGVDLWMHQDMVAYLHTRPMDSLITWSVGVGVTGAAILAGMWALAGRDATDGLPRKTPRKTVEDTDDDLPVGVKKIALTGMAASGVLTALGAQPMTLGGCLLIAVLGTGAWYKTRRQYRKALRTALAAMPDDNEMLALPAAEPADSVDTPAGQLLAVIERWVDSIAPSILSDTTLTYPEITDSGNLSFIVDGGKRGLLLATANAALNTIESVLRLDLPDINGNGGQEIVFDQPLGYGLNRGQLRMQVVNLAVTAAAPARVGVGDFVHAPDNPCSVRIGGYIDDGGHGFWDLADHDGACSGLAVGGMGLGKSSFLDLIAYRAMRLGFKVLYIDPADGSSSQILTEYATWTALGPEAGYSAYQFVSELATTRQKWITMHGVGKIVPGMIAPCLPNGLRPNPHCDCGGIVPPPILVINDECDQTYNAIVPGTSATKMGNLWGPLSKRLRKLCMGILAASHLTDIDIVGGNDMLRSTLALRNMLAMHVASHSGGTLIPGLPYNPSQLPDKPGRALLCGRAARGMQVMLDHLARRQDAEVVGGDVFAEDLFAQLPDFGSYQPDTLCADWYLPAAADGADTATQARDAAAADFRLIASGARYAAMAATSATEQPSLGGQLAPVPDLDWPDAPNGPLPALTDAELEEFYATQAAAAEESPTDKEVANDVIWRLLADKVTEKADLITRSGYGETQVRNALNRLMAGLPDGRRAERVKRGSYRPIMPVEVA